MSWDKQNSAESTPRCQRTTEGTSVDAGVPPRGIESIVADDLSFTSDSGLEFRQDAELLRACAAVVVEFMDHGGADEVSVAEEQVGAR
jgi:hypothetical protein